MWRIVLPLLDMGYQVDVRILNAVHYAVPQFRKVLRRPPLHCLPHRKHRAQHKK